MDELGLPLSPLALTNAFSHVAKRAGLPIKRYTFCGIRERRSFLAEAAAWPLHRRSSGILRRARRRNIYGHVIGSDTVRAVEAHRSGAHK